jgi:hypothetical protein
MIGMRRFILDCGFALMHLLDHMLDLDHLLDVGDQLDRLLDLGRGSVCRRRSTGTFSSPATPPARRPSWEKIGEGHDLPRVPSVT